MERLTRSATNLIAAITAIAWVIALVTGKSEQARWRWGSSRRG